MPKPLPGLAKKILVARSRLFNSSIFSGHFSSQLAWTTLFLYRIFMLKSISRTEKKSRGRPRTNPTSIHLTLLPRQLAALDAWTAKHSPGSTRSEAIRLLLEQNLPGHPRAHDHIAAHKASELAAKTIEGLADKSRPASEHARAKRRLIHGPKEFRDIRADQPKRKG